MRRLGLAAVLLGGCGIASVAAAPSLAEAVLAAEGVTVVGLGWCAEGMCLTGIARGEARAAGAVVRWDRVVRVVDVSVPLATVTEAVGGGAADGAAADGAAEGGAAATAGPAMAGGWGAVLSAALVAVDVEGITVVGAPVPTLSGRVWPTRHLVGEGVEVIDDTVHASVPTEFGLVVVAAVPGEGGVTVDATCASCRLPAPSEADAPLQLPEVRARGTWADGAFTGTVTVGAVHLRVAVERAETAVDPGATAFVAHVTLPETPIADVYGVFAPVVPELARARIGGTVRGEVDAAWPGGITRVAPVIDGFTVDGLVPAGLAGGSFSFRARDARGEEVLVTAGEGAPGWVPLERIGPWLPAAVIATEDAGFREHAGYSLDGMREAAAKNAEEGEVVRGGSTLTQQLAKNLFLDGTRSYARKLRELLYTVEMERELGKRRILEVYLNVVEFGPGLRGAQAGAQTYFLKDPAGLLPEEAAWLASILRFPRTAWRTQYLADRPDDRRVDWILANLRGVPEEARVAAIGRPVRLVPPP